MNQNDKTERKAGVKYRKQERGKGMPEMIVTENHRVKTRPEV